MLSLLVPPGVRKSFSQFRGNRRYLGCKGTVGVGVLAALVHGHRGVQGGMLDRWQAGGLTLSLDYLNVKLGCFEFFRPSFSPLCIF